MREVPKFGAIHHTKAGPGPGKVDWPRHRHVAPSRPPGRPAPGSIGREPRGRGPPAGQLRRGCPAPVGPQVEDLEAAGRTAVHAGHVLAGGRADGDRWRRRSPTRSTSSAPAGGGSCAGREAALAGGGRAPAGGRGQTRSGGAGAGRRAPGAVRRGAGPLPGRGLHPAARSAAVDEPRPGGGGVPVPRVPGGRPEGGLVAESHLSEEDRAPRRRCGRCCAVAWSGRSGRRTRSIPSRRYRCWTRCSARWTGPSSASARQSSGPRHGNSSPAPPEHRATDTTRGPAHPPALRLDQVSRPGIRHLVRTPRAGWTEARGIQTGNGERVNARLLSERVRSRWRRARCAPRVGVPSSTGVARATDGLPDDAAPFVRRAASS